MNIRRPAFSGCLVAMLLLPGCSIMGGKQIANDASSGQYEKARLSYRVDTDRLNGVRKGQAAGKLVSYEGLPASRLPSNSHATLEVRYPHPDKREGFAQVRVRIENHAEKSGVSWMGWWSAAKEELPGLKGAGWTQETWVLDVPQQDLQRIIGKLRTEGYFYAIAPPHDATRIDADLDGTKVSKKWTQLPELDALIHRARTEGRLVSSTKAPGSAAAPEQASSSVIAYKELLAQEQGVAIASDGATAPPMATIPPSVASPTGSDQIHMVRLPPIDSLRR